MANNLLKVEPLGMTFTKLWAECITIFGTRSRKTAKITVSTNTVKSDMSKVDQPVKSANQLHRAKEGKYQSPDRSHRVAKERN